MIKKEFDEKLKIEVSKYVKKIEDEVKDGGRGSAYSAIRKLGDRPFTVSKGREMFEIPEFIDNKFDDEQSVEALADYFSSISKEFEPINPENFPTNIKYELEKGKAEKILPIIEEFEVYSKIKKAKIPHSTVPGDLKRNLVKNCAVELVTPITMIYNEITKTKEYPRAWVIEQQIPIPKSNPPSSIDELRNISGTHFFSKQYESFISDCRLPIVEPFLDPGHCGGNPPSLIILLNYYIILIMILTCPSLILFCLHVLTCPKPLIVYLINMS